jgi:hypothetical protein
MLFRLFITVTFKGERFILAHGFRAFNPWSAGFGPLMRQNIMAVGVCAAKHLASRWTGSRERG